MITPAKSYRFVHDGAEIAAVTAGYLAVAAEGGSATAAEDIRVVAIDLSDRCWLLGTDAQGRFIRVIAGPVSAEAAVATAEAVLGGRDHGSATAVATTLALAVAAMKIQGGAVMAPRSKTVLTAHFPGTGPANKSCRDCEHHTEEGWHPSGRPWRWCQRALELAGMTHLDHRKASARLPGGTPACKYFEEETDHD